MTKKRYKLKRTEKQKTIQIPFKTKFKKILYINLMNLRLKFTGETDFLRIYNLKIFERECKNWPLNRKNFTQKIKNK